MVKAEGAECSQRAGIMVPRARADFRARAEFLLKFLLDAPLEFATSTTEALVVVRGLPFLS